MHWFFFAFRWFEKLIDDEYRVEVMYEPCWGVIVAVVE